MNKLVRAILVAFALLGITGTVHAQTMADMLVKGRIAATARTADDTDPILIIRYVGSSASATVAVSSVGDITLSHGASGLEAADSTVKCPSGGSSGVIDVSDTSCDTVQEVVNAINASDNWVAVPYAALLSDDINCGGSGCLKLLSATTANVAAGVKLYAETSVIKTGTVAILPSEFDNINTYLAGGSAKSGVKLLPNPFVKRTLLASAVGRATYASGSLFYSVYMVTPNYARTDSTESVTTLISGLAGAATTVDKVAVALSDNNRIMTDPGSKLIVRFYNTSAFATFIATFFGYWF